MPHSVPHSVPHSGMPDSACSNHPITLCFVQSIRKALYRVCTYVHDVRTVVCNNSLIVFEQTRRELSRKGGLGPARSPWATSLPIWPSSLVTADPRGRSGCTHVALLGNPCTCPTAAVELYGYGVRMHSGAHKCCPVSRLRISQASPQELHSAVRPWLELSWPNRFNGGQLRNTPYSVRITRSELSEIRPNGH